MKKTLALITMTGILLAGGATQAFADDTADSQLIDYAPPEISADAEANIMPISDVIPISAPITSPGSYSITVDGKTLGLGSAKIFEQNNRTMVPMRAVAEQMGFKVTWDDKTQTATAEKSDKKMTLRIGEDTYMYAAKPVGISYGQSLGAAPMLLDYTTYVPLRMFEILGSSFTVQGNTIAINTDGNSEDNQNENLQIPSPIVEYQTIDEAKKAVDFAVALPDKLPAGYQTDFISTINTEPKVFQIIYRQGDNEITYRAAKTDIDISGDYNIYKIKKTLKSGNLDIAIRGNQDIAGATWQQNGITYSLMFSSEITEESLLEIIGSIK